MAQRAASYGEAVLHKSLTMKHCSAKASQYEAAPLHSAMKHSAYAAYDEKMKNESLITSDKLPLRRFVTKTHISFVLEISGNYIDFYW